MAKNKRLTRNRAVQLARQHVDADNRKGLLEALEVGLLHLQAKYGHHSHEARSAERMIVDLQKPYGL